MIIYSVVQNKSNNTSIEWNEHGKKLQAQIKYLEYNHTVLTGHQRTQSSLLL